MEQKSIEYLKYTLLNWPIVDVRTVPGIMHQVVCRTYSIDSNMEYRFHWFLDCTETYVHNHRYTFDTYCLEGEYMEKLWEIIDDDSGTTTYQHSKTSGNKFGSIMPVSGVLRTTDFRHHFPGNILHVDTNQFHSISPITRSSNHVFKFVARQICSSAAENTYVLSPTESIEAPVDQIRPATPEERQCVYLKLEQILERILFNDAFG